MAPAVTNPEAAMADRFDRERMASPDNLADALTLLRNLPEPPVECQVCVVGAGPAGLMLASNLTRFGVNVEVIDDRADQTPVGR